LAHIKGEQVSKAEVVKDDKGSARNKAYGAATTALRDTHRAEFALLLEQEYAKAGLTLRRRKTAEERAVEQAVKDAEKAIAAEQKRLQKIADLEAQIAAIKAESAPVLSVVEDDPLSVFSEA
jgi:hypothetical protein